MEGRSGSLFRKQSSPHAFLLHFCRFSICSRPLLLAQYSASLLQEMNRMRFIFEYLLG